MQHRETFTFFGMQFDVSLIKEHMEKGTIKPELVDLDITEWATKIMALDRSKPDYEPAAFALRVDYDHIRAMTDERMLEPILAVHTKIGMVFADGNHRIAKAYMKGHDTLKGYVVPQAMLKKAQRPLRQQVMKFKKATEEVA